LGRTSWWHDYAEKKAVYLMADRKRERKTERHRRAQDKIESQSTGPQWSTFFR
jgi:hypothetical protein